MFIKIILLLLSTILIVHPISAVEMESPRFRIESGSIDFTVPVEKTATPDVILPSNPDAIQFDSEGIIVKTDNQSTESRPFRFIIEKSLLSMGNVTPNNPSLISSRVSVAGGRTVYQIVIAESDLLRKLSGETIPDTSCSSQKKCTPTTATLWDSPSTYGFGYTVEGQDIPADFLDTDYYRPFANSKKNIPPTILMKAVDKTNERHSTITLKTILSAIQADGTYENTITLTASPGY